MDDYTKKHLFDIKICIEKIENYLWETNDFDSYSENEFLQDAVERNLEIIGEAMNRILKRQPDFQLKEAKQIVGLRNLVIHQYDQLDELRIWEIINNNLPRLKIKVLELLEKE